jgi:hypothetical protein
MWRARVCWSTFLILAPASPAPAAELTSGLDLGDPIAQARRAAVELCESHQEVEVDPPSFPLAREEEIHLLCRGWKTPGGTVDRAAFIFGDGVLTAIEARGGAVAALAGESPDDDTYLHYRVFNDGRVFDDWHGLADPKADLVWLLSDGALHLNLFTWSNPLLAGNAEGATGAPAYRQSAVVPALLDFDVPLEHQLARYEAECPLLDVGRDERIWLPNQPANQTQVNCFGYEYAGFPRKLEAVYGDGRLHVVWILTGKGEEDRLRRALTQAFGQPIAVDDRWDVFADGRVGLRKDKPEILLLSEEIAPLYRSEMGLE